MASSALLSPCPRSQLNVSIPKTSKFDRKSSNFLVMSSSSSHRPSQLQLLSSVLFPCNLELPSLNNLVPPAHVPPSSDSADENFTESLEDFGNLRTLTREFSNAIPKESADGLLIRDPPWISSLFMKSLYRRQYQGVKLQIQDIERRKYHLLRRRQIKAETEAWENMVEEYRQLEQEMCEKKLAPNLPYVKKLFLGWFEPLRDAIDKEQKTQKSKKQKDAFAPYIDSLPADKMAVIVMHKMMGLLMMGQDVERSVPVVQAAVQIGMAVEQEVRIHSFLEKAKKYQEKKFTAQENDNLTKEASSLRKRINILIKQKRILKVKKLLKNEELKPWGRDIQAKLGCRLIELLTETAYIQSPVNQSADCPPDIRPAFWHMFKIAPRDPGQSIIKRYGVIECNHLVLAGLERNVKHMMIPYVPMLIPPKKWKGYDKGGYLFLPSYLMRTHGSRRQQDAVNCVPAKQLQKIYEALDALGSTKWRVNRKVLGVVESIWAGGGRVAGLVDCSDVPIPELVSDDLIEKRNWRWSVRKAKKINRERHAQRCDIELKLSVARRMKDEEGFYYPHNLDFRGRAYPMHPHLNHLSCDLCRGVLEFAEGRPLGKSGLRWLKIHLANLVGGGVEKLSYDKRLEFVDNHIKDILDSADNPLNGDQWWLTAEDPFQCLAACINMTEALKSKSPHTVISHLPIHQDGSCNGLQHYAALGRDGIEAAAVNLVAGEKPSDVYSEIAVRVHDIMKRDCNKDPTTYPKALLAKLLVDQVDRKLVKQTVMTSVYGVTFVGAREQIRRRLQEKGHITDDRLLFNAACYAAKVTLAALGELFQAARDIMSWLGDCAKVIASENQPVRWTTPLGLPVVQPYFKNQRHVIRTSLQVLALQREGDMVEVRKQRTAFPPNFVHSLDGSHMMMTAIACRDAGLHFAGVHDSFWTHACDIDKMNQILREKFVELYNKPILENLLESFQTEYPTLVFPPLPERGNFNLREVLDSPYFFN